MSRIIRNNLIKMWLESGFRAAGTTLLSILQVYLLFYGLSEVQISIHSSLAQIFGLAVSLSCSGIASGFRDSRKPICLMHIIGAVLMCCYGMFCFFRLSVGVFYICVLLIGSLLSVSVAIMTIFDYKLPCEVMEIQYYAVYAGYGGIFSGVISALIGVLIPVLYTEYDFLAVTGGCFFASAVCSAAALCLNASLQPLLGKEPVRSSALRVNPIDDLKKLLSNGDFRVLLLPNLFRGFGAAPLSLIALLALRGLDITEKEITLFASVASIGGILSSLLYASLVKHFGSPCTALVGGVIFGGLCFSMMGGTAMFLALYCFSHIGYNIIGSAIPNMVYQSVEQSLISSFHTWRLVINSLGTAVAVPIYGVLLEVFPPQLLLSTAFFWTFLCVLGYYLHYRTALAVREQ